jgi:serine/threonine protein kinase
MLDSRSEAFHNVGSVSADAEADTEAGPSLVGTVLAGRYRIERLLGSGGMGSVYRAEHVLMRKACAVKVLHREMTQVKEVVARFEREAVAAARIEHPNVATATDFGQLENGSSSSSRARASAS